MVMLQPKFVYGVGRKSIALGFVAAIVGFMAVSASFALAVVIGTVVSTINVRIVAIGIDKMLRAAEEEDVSARAWSILLAFKMFALIALIWVLIARAGVDAVGFVFGFSLFMPAVGWQLLVDNPNEDAELSGFDEEE